MRAISHNPDRIPADLRDRCEVIAGSLDDAAVLTRGFADAESVFWCVPQSNKWEDGAAYYGAFTRAATDALAATGSAARIVAVSGGGYGAPDAGFMSLLTETENALNASRVATRHLRCGYFMENLHWFRGTIESQGAIFSPYAADVPVPWVAARDIATVAVRFLRDRTWADQAGVAVYGAEDLTMNEAATIIGDVLGKPVRYVQTTDAQTEAFLRGVGSADGFIRSYLAYAHAVNRGEFGRDKRTAEGTTTTRLSDWVRENLAPAA